MGRFWLMVLALLTAFVPAAFAQAEYDIHVLLPLTGGAAFIGNSMKTAMSLAENQINNEGFLPNTRLKLVFHDDQSSPQVGVQLAQEILQSNPAIVFGSAISAICNAVGPVMTQTVLYCLSPGIHPSAGSNIFSAGGSSTNYVKALFRFFQGRHWTRIAVLTTTDASGQDADAAIAQFSRDQDSQSIVAYEHMTPTDVTVSAQIEKIKAAKPDALIVWATGSAISTVYRGLVQAGFDMPVAASPSTMIYTQMLQYTNFLPKELYFSTPDWVAQGSPSVENPKVQKQQTLFFEAMKSVGAIPDAASETVWDPTRIVAGLLKKLGPKASAAALREGIASTSDFVGIDGVYDFKRSPQRGLDVSNTVIARWDAQAKYWRVVSKPGGEPVSVP